MSDNLNNWKNQDLINKFYKETEKCSFYTELKSTVDKINKLNKINKQIIFFEKSWTTNKECFVNQTINKKESNI